MRFMSSNSSTYLNAKHKKDLKIYGNPFYKGGFCKNFCSIIKQKRFNYMDFQKYILLEDPNSLEDTNHKVFFSY